MKRSKRMRLILTLAAYTEKYVIGRKLHPAQRDLVDAIAKGRRVIVVRPNRRTGHLHTVNGQFFTTELKPAPKPKLLMYVDEYDERSVADIEALNIPEIKHK